MQADEGTVWNWTEQIIAEVSAEFKRKHILLSVMYYQPLHKPVLCNIYCTFPIQNCFCLQKNQSREAGECGVWQKINTAATEVTAMRQKPENMKKYQVLDGLILARCRTYISLNPSSMDNRHSVTENPVDGAHFDASFCAMDVAQNGINQNTATTPNFQW